MFNVVAVCVLQRKKQKIGFIFPARFRCLPRTVESISLKGRICFTLVKRAAAATTNFHRGLSEEIWKAWYGCFFCCCIPSPVFLQEGRSFTRDDEKEWSTVFFSLYFIPYHFFAVVCGGLLTPRHLPQGSGSWRNVLRGWRNKPFRLVAVEDLFEKFGSLSHTNHQTSPRRLRWVTLLIVKKKGNELENLDGSAYGVSVCIKMYPFNYAIICLWGQSFAVWEFSSDETNTLQKLKSMHVVHSLEWYLKHKNMFSQYSKGIEKGCNWVLDKCNWLNKNPSLSQ